MPHTIRDEITKWFINENIVQDTKSVKHLSDEQIIMKYLKIVNAMNLPMTSSSYH